MDKKKSKSKKPDEPDDNLISFRATDKTSAFFGAYYESGRLNSDRTNDWADEVARKALIKELGGKCGPLRAGPQGIKKSGGKK